MTDRVLRAHDVIYWTLSQRDSRTPTWSLNCKTFLPVLGLKLHGDDFSFSQRMISLTYSNENWCLLYVDRFHFSKKKNFTPAPPSFLRITDLQWVHEPQFCIIIFFSLELKRAVQYIIQLSTCSIYCIFIGRGTEPQSVTEVVFNYYILVLWQQLEISFYKN